MPIFLDIGLAISKMHSFFRSVMPVCKVVTNLITVVKCSHYMTSTLMTSFARRVKTDVTLYYNVIFIILKV